MLVGCMRVPLLGCLLAIAPHARASSPTVVLELLDAEPIGVKVTAPVGKMPCESATVLFQGVLTKSKPLALDTPATRICVQQTYAPFATVGWSLPAIHTRAEGTVLSLRLRSHQLATPTPVPVPPLVVNLTGSERVGLRVSAGSVMPCTSELDTPLFFGTLEPGKPLTIPTQASCVCVQQTFAPFVAAGWTGGQIHCRVHPCFTYGKGKYKHPKACLPDPALPFVVSVPSRAD